LIQRCGCTLVQDSKPINGLLGGLNDNKRFGHDQLPVFWLADLHLACIIASREQ